MKISLDKGTASYRIRAYGEGNVTVNETVYTGPVIVMPERIVAPWPVDDISALGVDDFDLLDGLDRDIVLLGTGRHQRFPDPGLIARMAQRGVGLEVMDTAAACRTFNVLMAEDRRVAAALLMIGSAD